MSNRPPNDGPGPLDQVAMRYLRHALDTTHPSDEPYVLSEVESGVIQRTKVMTLSLAALVGVMGVLFLYIPQYNWPYLFVDTSVTIIGETYQIPIITILYGLVLVYIEVNLLIWMNLLGVRLIMQVCQFPKQHDARYERHLRALADAALERGQQRMLRFGIDPYLNLPRWGLSLFFGLNLVKAAMSNLLLKFIFRRLLGRYVLRQVTDLAGIPIYAVWNAYASWQVLHEAQVRVMAPATIREFVNELYDEWGRDEAFRSRILDALQYVAILKRQYNYAHFLLTETLVERFELSAKPIIDADFMAQFTSAPVEVRRSLERLIVFGVLVDGRLSWVEKRQLRQLRKKGFLSYSVDEIERIGTDYNQGRGLWV